MRIKNRLTIWFTRCKLGIRGLHLVNLMCKNCSCQMRVQASVLDSLLAGINCENKLLKIQGELIWEILNSLKQKKNL